jgi:protein-disulfide isomerase
MSSTMSKIADAAMIVCAIVVTGVSVSRWLQRPTDPTGATQRVANWKSELRFPRRVGASSAPYQLVVWTDYQCPACKQFERDLTAARQSLGDSLSVVYRYFPLSSAHPLAFEAAVMAECASKEGKFAQMHEALFATSLTGTAIPVDSIATRAGISDRQAFSRCLSDSSSTSAAAAVRADVARGQALGLHGTPGVQVGDQLGLGAIPSAELIPRLRVASKKFR